MRLLLFLVSFLFSIIFYWFYNLTQWKNILWNEMYKLSLDSISWNLLIETIIFLSIWIIFIFYFTPLNTDKALWVNKTSFFYFIFYTFLLTPIFFSIISLNFIIWIFIFIFIFWDILFSYLSNLEKFSSDKLKFRFLGLIVNYLSAILSTFYIFILDFSYYLFLIILFSIFFNIEIHKRYTNYPSLFLSIILIILLIYYLFLKLYDFYILLF